jgi:hypothetical protein
VEALDVEQNSDDELETALLGVRQREKAKNKKLKKKEMKKAHRLRGIVASGTNHGQPPRAPPPLCLTCDCSCRRLHGASG